MSLTPMTERWKTAEETAVALYLNNRTYRLRTAFRCTQSSNRSDMLVVDRTRKRRKRICCLVCADQRVVEQITGQMLAVKIARGKADEYPEHDAHVRWRGTDCRSCRSRRRGQVVAKLWASTEFDCGPQDYEYMVQRSIEALRNGVSPCGF
jgi:hypothetical protein